MPISGWLMIGWCHCGSGPPEEVTARPSTLKKRPVRWTRLPVPGAKDQPSSALNGMRRTSKVCARPRSASQASICAVSESAAPAEQAAERCRR
jgi:hypothetical protein